MCHQAATVTKFEYLQVLVGTSMLFCLFFQVTSILEKFPVWKEFKDQKHDLFLTDRPISGYITGLYITKQMLIINMKFLFPALTLEVITVPNSAR